MKCVKSVHGEFSSGVSIWRNKRTHSDLGAPYCLCPPAWGCGGTFLRLWA